MNKIAHLKYDNCGAGNRLLQYIYARIWCEDNGYELSHDGIIELDIPKNKIGFGLDIHRPQSFLQNYHLYENHLDRIRTWECFNSIDDKDIDDSDLVIHLRAGNRLLGRNAKYSATAKELKCTLDGIDFQRIHIVTNLKKYTEWSLNDIFEEIENLKQNGGSGEPPETYQDPNYPFLDPEESLDITNSFISMLNEYNSIWVGQSIKEDFNYLRKFRKILFPRSTLSWCAAATGVANEVYVYGPWAPHKAKTQGSFGETNYKGWKSWM
jgi:hypothetical protein